jgi:hypothetical protein
MFKTKSGLTYWQVIKYWFYDNIGKKYNRCLCGGKVRTIYHSHYPDILGWETSCQKCDLILDED